MKAKSLLFTIIFLLLITSFCDVASAVYAGSKNSDVYHYSECYYVDRILPENLVYFDTPEDAISRGYRPCLKCSPPTSSPIQYTDSDDDCSSDSEGLYYYDTDTLDSDSDSDGLTASEEVNDYSTDPINSDSDGDGLTDSQEVNDYGTNPLDSDSDGDDLNDREEVNYYGTSPLSSHTDGDDLSDFEEISEYGTDPLEPDSDDDGLIDSQEVLGYSTDPNDSDSDRDGLSDSREIYTYYTNPIESDTDYDDLSDSEEVNYYNTNPLEDDSDEDGFNDYEEIYTYHTDPTDYYSNERKLSSSNDYSDSKDSLSSSYVSTEPETVTDLSSNVNEFSNSDIEEADNVEVLKSTYKDDMAIKVILESIIFIAIIGYSVKKKKGRK